MGKVSHCQKCGTEYLETTGPCVCGGRLMDGKSVTLEESTNNLILRERWDDPKLKVIDRSVCGLISADELDYGQRRAITKMIREALPALEVVGPVVETMKSILNRGLGEKMFAADGVSGPGMPQAAVLAATMETHSCLETLIKIRRVLTHMEGDFDDVEL